MKSPTSVCAVAVLITLSSMSCGQAGGDKKNPAELWALKKDSIRVGMTYDEVDRILGRPFQITRGVNNLVPQPTPDYNNKTLAELKQDLMENEFQKAVAETSTSANVWIIPRSVNTIGQLLYVTWVYSEATADTVYIWVPKFVRGGDTTRVPQYVVNNKVVTKEEFDKVGQLVYRTYTENWIISKEEWEREKAHYGSGTPEPKPAKKEIRYLTRVIERQRVADASKKYFAVSKMFCVVFDASSGRVVQSGFQPFDVAQVH